MNAPPWSTKYIITGLLFVLLTTACTYRSEYEMLGECAVKVTYKNTIKGIVDTRCAISGCHVSGFQPGDFTSYMGIKEKADNGKLNFMVFDLQLMPPSGNSQLTEDELDLLSCWISQDAKEE